MAVGNPPVFFELAERALDAVLLPVAVIFRMLQHFAAPAGWDDLRDASDGQSPSEAITLRQAALACTYEARQPILTKEPHAGWQGLLVDTK